MRVLIIEDESIAAEKLFDFIKRYDDSIEIMEKLESIRDVQAWFKKNKRPDLIFSDIELLDGNIFGLLEKEDWGSPIIFTTAYDQFLLPAFERNGIAYLLKPFTYESFVGAMQKLENLKEKFIFSQVNFWKEIQERFKEPEYKEKFVVKMRGSIKLIESRQVPYFQIQNGVVFAFDLAGNKFPLNENLSQLEQVLDPKMFFRINRSEMVNVNFIEGLESYFNDRLVVILRNSKAKLIASTKRTPKLRKWIENL